MSSLFSHIFIPLAILFIFSYNLKINLRNIVVLSFFGILPDADIFLFHRASFHNIFILIIPFLVFIFVKERKEISGLISFYLSSHLILDIFDGGVYLLYPFYNKVFYVLFEIFFNKGNGIIPIINYGTNDDIVNMARKWEPMISSENIGIMILIIIIVFLLLIKNHFRNDQM